MFKSIKIPNQKPKTIAIDARMYGAGQTGIGNYIYHLMKYLFEIDEKNNYLIFLLPEEFEKFNPPNERVKKIKVTAKWYSWKEQLILPFNFLKYKIDLIHFPHFNSPILYHLIVGTYIKIPLLPRPVSGGRGWGRVKLAAKKPTPNPSREGNNTFLHFHKTKTVTTIHDLTPYYFPGHKMNSWLRRKSFKLVFSTAVKKSSRVIAVSEYTKKDVIKNFLNKTTSNHLREKNNKIAVIYEGVDEQFQVIKNYGKIKAIKNKYKITKPFIFYTGVWRNHKNLVGLIKAFDLIVNKYHLDYQLVLGGKEDFYYPEVRKTWEKLNLGDQIIRAGFISQEKLPLFYNAADVFVIPSFREGFGLIGLEAMACGTPVISSNKTCLPEILGGAAIYFDPNNCQEMAEKISQVIRDENLKNNLIQKGFSRIKKYDWRRMAEETLKIYKEVLK